MVRRRYKSREKKTPLQTLHWFPIYTFFFLSSMFVLLQSALHFSVFYLPPQFPFLPQIQRLACGYVVMEFDGWRLVAVL